MAFISARSIKPKGKAFDLPRIEKAIRDAVQESADDAQELYESCVATWKHKPAFEQTKTKDGIIVGTEDQIFQYVDEGTRPHTIQVKNGRVLRFRGGYSPKTTPGKIGSQGGGASGGFVYTSKPIQHPGTAPRDFTGKVEKQVQGTLPVIMAQKLGGALGD